MNPFWICQGLELIQKGPFPDRDFLLPAVDNKGRFVKRPATYSQAVSISAKVLMNLRRPVRTLGGQELVEGEAPLLKDPKVISFWSEHSERATLPSLAGLLELFTKEQLDKLGRWSEGAQSDAYVRTFYTTVRMIQMGVGKALRGKDAYSRLRERACILSTEEWLKSHGYVGDQVKEVLDDLGQVAADIGQWHLPWKGATEEDLPRRSDPAEQLIESLGPAGTEEEIESKESRPW